MFWFRLLLKLLQIFYDLAERFKRRKYVQQGEEQAESRALKEHHNRVEQAKKARAQVRAESTKDNTSSLSSSHPSSSTSSDPSNTSHSDTPRRLRDDPYQRD